jgi:hypothetical protein
VNVDLIHPSAERSMPKNMTERAADNLTRVQLMMFQMLGDQINLTQNDRGRTLRLADLSSRCLGTRKLSI